MAEEDEGISDNWEDLDESGELDRRLEEIKTRTTVLSSSEAKNQEDFTVPILKEEGTRTLYQPQVKILKRNPAASRVPNGEIRQAKPIKTLEQREAEYAEARQRILGSATPDTDCSDDTDVDTRPTRLLQNMEELKVTENVIRQPHGPDGSSGFKSAR